MNIKKALFSIFHFTNSADTGLVIEECGNFEDDLSGYFIILPEDKKASLEIFLRDVFPNHSEEITAAFSDQDNTRILQCIKVYYPDVSDSEKSLTRQFINAYGNTDLLLQYGPSANLIMAEECMKNLEVQEEEISQTYDSMSSQADAVADGCLNNNEEDDAEMDRKLAEENKSLKALIAKQEETIAKLQAEHDYQEKFYPGFTFEKECGEVFEYIMSADGAALRKLNRDIALKIVNSKDDRQITRYAKYFYDAMNRDKNGGY